MGRNGDDENRQEGGRERRKETKNTVEIMLAVKTRNFRHSVFNFKSFFMLFCRSVAPESLPVSAATTQCFTE